MPPAAVCAQTCGSDLLLRLVTPTLPGCLQTQTPRTPLWPQVVFTESRPPACRGHVCSAPDLLGEPSPRLATRVVHVCVWGRGEEGLDSADGWGQKASRHFWGLSPGEVPGAGQQSPPDRVYASPEKEVLRCIRPAERTIGE